VELYVIIRKLFFLIVQLGITAK